MTLRLPSPVPRAADAAMKSAVCIGQRHFVFAAHSMRMRLNIFGVESRAARRGRYVCVLTVDDCIRKRHLREEADICMFSPLTIAFAIANVTGAIAFRPCKER